jgi:hypothetical protein
MYMTVPSAATEKTEAVPDGHLSLALALTALGTLWLGIWPAWALAPAQTAWQAFQQGIARL